jgi:uncharacterized membrane protein YgdD (TMEM256/DUF423 family)
MTRKHLVTVASLGLFFMVMIIINIQIVNGNLAPKKQSLYDLATNVLMIHTVALLATAFMNRYLSRSNLKAIFYFFSLGSVAFSAPLYLLATDEVTNITLGILKPVALIGAIALMIGWLVLLYTGFTYKHKKRAIHNQSK